MCEKLDESTLMCAGEFGPVVGGISWDGDIDEIVCECTSRVGVWIAQFDLVDERHATLAGVSVFDRLPNWYKCNV